MGKHDKPDNFEAARIEELESRLAFSEETNRKLREALGRANRWMSEVEAAANDKVAALQEENAKLKETIVRLAVG